MSRINGNMIFNPDGSGVIENAFIEQVGSLPTGVKGRIVYLTANYFNNIPGHYFFNGAAWQQFTPIAVSGSNGSSTVNTISMGNSNGMSFYLTNGSIVGSYTNPSTAGLISGVNVSAGVTSGNISAMTFSNSNGVSFGLNNGVITGSVSPGVAPGSVSAGSTNAALGQVVFSNSNGVSFGLNGSTLTASVAPSGTISANGSSVALGQVIFSNSNNISFGMNGSTVTASAVVPTQTNQTEGIYAIGNTTGQASSSTFDARSQSFSGAGIVSAGISGNAVVISATVPSQSFGVSNLGNTAGSTGTQSGQVILAGGANVTLSVATGAGGAQTITINGAGGSGGNQTGISGVQVSNATFTSGTVSLVNANGISFGSSGSNGISASYSVPSTAGLISGVNVSAGTTSNNLSALTFNNANNVSFGLNGSTVTASVVAQTVQTQNLFDLTVGGNIVGTGGLVSSGTMTLVGGANITLSQNGNAITISAGTAAAQNVNVSAGTSSGPLGTIAFQNVNGVSFGLNGSTVTASVSQSIQPVAVSGSNGSQVFSTLSFGNSNGASFYVTNGSVVASYSVPSTAGLISGVNVSGGTTSNNLSALTFNNANGVSFGLNGSVITGSVASQSVQTQNLQNVTLSGNTAGVMAQISSGTMTLAGGNNITLSQNGNAITISGVNTVAQTNQTIGAYAVGNTTGQSSSATFDARSLSFDGANGVSVGFSNGSVVISGATGGGGGGNDITLSGNTAGTLTLINSGTLTLAGGNNITLSQSGNAVTILGASAAAAPVNFSAGTTSGNIGSVVFSNANNLSFGLNGSTITGSASQSIQTIGVYGSSNTTGQSSSSTYDARSLSIVGYGLISVGQSNGSIQISGPATSSYIPLSVGMSTFGNTAGSTGIASNQLILVGGNNITLSGSTNAGSMSLTIAGGAGGGGGVDAQISGNTAGTTALVSTGTMTLAGGANITLSQNGNAITIAGASVAAAPVNFSAGTTSGNIGSVVFSNANGVSFGLNGSTITASAAGGGGGGVDAQISGNTSGTTALVSTGTMTLAGGNNITLSQSGNAITISGANTVAQTNQTIGVFASSNTTGQSSSSTYDARSLSIVGYGLISVGQSNGSIQISGPNTTSYAPFSVGMSSVGNTSGNTGFASNQLMLVGGNNITLSGSTNAGSMSLTISGASIAAAPVNFSAGSASGNLGSVVFSNANGVSFGLNGSTITASAVGGAGGIDAQISGNTSGTTALVSTGTMVLAGGNNITLSQSGNAITISGANTVASGIDAKISGNTSGTTALVSSGTMVLAGGNNITLSQNGNAITISGANTAPVNFSAGTASGNLGSVVFSNANGVSFGLNGSTITASAAGGAGGIDAQISGNTSGTTALVSTGTIVLAGGNNITLSQSGNAITISGANAAGGGVDAQISGNTSGTTALVSTGTVTLAGGNNITLSQSGNAITISGANTVAQTNQTIGVFASSNTTGQSSSSTYDARSLSIVGYGIISVGQSNGSIQISAPNTTSYAPLSVGISTLGNTSGNTGVVSNQLVLVGGNNITLSGSTNAGSMSLTISGAAGGGGGIDAQISGNTSGTTALVSTGTVVLAGGNNITLSQNGNAITISGANTAPVNFSAGTTSGNLGSVVFANSNGVSFGLNGSTITASAAGGGGGGIDAQISGNTSGTTALVSTGTIVLAGGNNITLSQSGNAITISGANSAAQTNQTLGFYAAGNTTQNSSTTLDARTVSFDGQGAVSVGFSNGSVQVSGPSVSQLTGAGAVTIQTNGNTISIAAPATSSLVGAGVITISTNGSTVSVSAPAMSNLAGTGNVSLSSNGSTIFISGIIPQNSFMQALPMITTTATQLGNGSIQVYPMNNARGFTASRGEVYASISMSSSSNSSHAGAISMFMGLYTLSGSTLSLATSGSQSYQWTNTSNNSLGSVSGFRRLSVPLSVNFNGNQDIFVAVMSQTASTNANWFTASNVAVPFGPIVQLQGLIGDATNNSKQYMPGMGYFSASSAALPSSMALSAISGAGNTNANADYYAAANFANMTA